MKFISRHFRELLLILTAFICVALLVVGVMIMAEYTANLQENAATRGLLQTTTIAENIKGTVTDYEKKAASAAEAIVVGSRESQDSFLAVINSIFRDSRFSDIQFVRYLKDGVEYSEYGEIYDMSLESQSIRNHINDNEVVCTGVVTDRYHTLAMVCFIVPVENFEYADRLLIFFHPSVVVAASEGINRDYLENSLITAVCSNEGEVLNILYQKENEYQLHNNIFEAIKNKVNDKSAVDTVREVIRTGTADSISIKIDGVDHVLSVESIGKSDTSFSIVSIYQSDEIYNGGYTTISIVLGMVSMFLILLLVVIVGSLVNSHRTNKKLSAMKDTDNRLGCGNRNRFERETAEILNQHKATSFAIVMVAIKHYTYFSNQLGYESVTDILKQVEAIIKKQVGLYETYGYISNGQFVMLLHYKKLEDLASRLNMIYILSSNYKKNIPEGYKLELYGGIYETDMKLSDNINEAVDFAVIASDSSKDPQDLGTFHRYSAELYEKKRIAGYIEVHMESALKNKEFRVFYQPKYNIRNNRPDGSEALVRWYDEKKDEYALPAVFLPLFETNGFITKLDRYVYEEVCRYIHDAVAGRERVYPVSVNVSRLTAAEPDFVDFYIKTKQKYGIANGFICIEFTESIAYENYEKLRGIVAKLHAAGFRCSIDDFGTGYSSYNILKELQMDEIKLDRFFIQQGLSSERDMKILSSIIKLSKDLNMSVTQEGVETEEDLKMLKKLGCDVIQGYYYSKPLGLADYITFLTSKKISLDLLD